ncbi:Na+/H+ antiporter subunit E [Aestuariimicrobium ganziense]|uniref:Na+/H+ antiporter subunit E n=1 Tax=Aestuariimicrobium ganziense TaxID=2773677 RepID=UPI00194293D8|nr:Na+/H+ antiporter subunit E [Aestuariimicrobium ganziense]
MTPQVGPAVKPPSRWRVQWRQVVALVAVWLVLVGNVTVVTVVGGFLLAWLVTVIFPLPPVPYKGRLNPWGVIKLLVILVRDLAVASFSLALFAFGRKMPPTAIVRVQLRSDSDVYQVMVAQLNTIVPGTIVLDARQRTRMLYLHVFDGSDPTRLEAEVADALGIERRVVNAMGSKQERLDLAEKSRHPSVEDRVTPSEQRAALAEEDM